MSVAIGIPLLALVAVLQSSLLPHVSVGGIRPDMMVVFVISWSLLRGVEEGLIWAFIGGIFIDLFSDAPFGFTVISLLCTTFVITSVGSAAFGSNIVFSLVSILAASLLNQVILVALLSLSENAPVWNESLIRIITLSTLINLCLLPLILWPLSWLHGTTRRQDVTL
jgi:rod shape-determining protein MreD